jgi:hypothetical protein
MTRAATTWNTFYLASRGAAVFNYGSDGSPNSSSNNVADPNCSDTAPADGTVIYKRGVWTRGQSIIALTRSCRRTIAGESLPIFTNAIIEMNYQHFFTQASNRFPDLQSIFLHELGHLLGLAHSCGPIDGGRPNVQCPNSTAADTLNLRSTVMYPDWEFSGSVGEQRRALTENDMGRANCLY